MSDDPLTKARETLACIEEMEAASYAAGRPDSPFHSALTSLREQLSPALVRALCDEVERLREYFDASEERAAVRLREPDLWRLSDEPELPEEEHREIEAASTRTVKRLAAARAAVEALSPRQALREEKA